MAYRPQEDPLDRPEVRWTVGCLIGALALAGATILALLLAFWIQPPTWVQVLVGVVLVLAVVALTVLVANALGRPSVGADGGGREVGADGE